MPTISQHLTSIRVRESFFPFHLEVQSLKASFPCHRHDFLECSFIVEGQGTQLINGVPNRLHPGVFSFVLPYQTHEIRLKSDERLTLYNCQFRFDILRDCGNEFKLHNLILIEEDNYPPYVEFQGSGFLNIKEAFTEILEEYCGAELWKNEFIKLKLEEILIKFNRLRCKQGTMARWGDGKEGAIHFWKILHFIHANYRDDLSLKSVSEQFNISPTYLCDLFKKNLGQSFGDFVHSIRINYACGLLASTEMKVYDIALEAGFGAYSTFSRLFRQLKGTTPIQYRSHAFRKLEAVNR